MGLIDSLRKAEEQGRGVARKGMERARDVLADTESRLRRQMRMRPNPHQAGTRSVPPGPLPNPIQPPPATTSRHAIEQLPHRASEEDAA